MGFRVSNQAIDSIVPRGLLDLATCIHMEFFKVEGGRVFVNHCGAPLFPLPNSYKPTCVDPSWCIYDDEIDVNIDEDEPQP